MLLLTQRPTSESIPRTGTFVMPGGARKLKAPKLMVVQLVGEFCSAADARSAMSRSGETMSNEVRIVCLTLRLTDPAPVVTGMQPRRNRGVRCSRFVRPRLHVTHLLLSERKNESLHFGQSALPTPRIGSRLLPAETCRQPEFQPPDRVPAGKNHKPIPTLKM